MVANIVFTTALLIGLAVVFLKDGNQRRALLVGALLYQAVRSLLQDFYGQEAWIKHIQDEWSPASTTGPLALLIIFLCFFALSDLRRGKKED